MVVFVCDYVVGFGLVALVVSGVSLVVGVVGWLSGLRGDWCLASRVLRCLGYSLDFVANCCI